MLECHHVSKGIDLYIIDHGKLVSNSFVQTMESLVCASVSRQFWMSCSTEYEAIMCMTDCSVCIL